MAHNNSKMREEKNAFNSFLFQELIKMAVAFNSGIIYASVLLVILLPIRQELLTIPDKRAIAVEHSKANIISLM